MSNVVIPTPEMTAVLADKARLLSERLRGLRGQWLNMKTMFMSDSHPSLFNHFLGFRAHLPLMAEQLVRLEGCLSLENPLWMSLRSDGVELVGLLPATEKVVASNLEPICSDEPVRIVSSETSVEVELTKSIDYEQLTDEVVFAAPTRVHNEKELTSWPALPYWLANHSSLVSLSAAVVMAHKAAPEGVDQELWAVFCEEVGSLLDRMTPIVQKSLLPFGESLDVLRRDLHTVKGSARMMGMASVGDAVHELEQSLYPVIAHDSGHGWSEWQKSFWSWSGELEGLVRVDGSGEAQPVKVPAAWLDEWVQAQQNLGLLLQQFANAHLGWYRQLRDQELQVQQVYRHLRELEIHTDLQMHARRRELARLGAEFDSLEMDRFDRQQELTRFISEGIGDLQDTQQALKGWLQDQSNWISARQTGVRHHYQQLLQARLIRFGDTQDRFQRIVSQVASELNKEARLEIQGGDVEVDRALLDQMLSPLEHLLRNSLAHGIESPQDRLQAGKPAQGLLRLSLSATPLQLTICLTDDGRGLQWPAIEKKARELGWIMPGQIADEAFLTDCLFRSGFSTAEVVSQISGRGVGMDVVRSEVVEAGGNFTLVSKMGLGLSVTINLPNNVSGVPVFVMRTNKGQVWAISKQDVLAVEQDEEAVGRASQLPDFLEFGDRVSLRLAHPETGRVMHLRVQEVLSTEEVTVQPVATPLQRVPGIRGACVLSDGSLAWLVEPWNWLTIHQLPQVVSVASARSRKTILVVDDSLTMRRAAERILLGAGYDVVHAADGEEALSAASQRSFDAVLLDVEMPRLDGFEVLRNLRLREDSAKWPVAMITSRTAAKHKEHAMSLGADAYFGKPYHPQELLDWLKKRLT